MYKKKKHILYIAVERVYSSIFALNILWPGEGGSVELRTASFKFLWIDQWALSLVAQFPLGSQEVRGSIVHPPHLTPRDDSSAMMVLWDKPVAFFSIVQARSHLREMSQNPPSVFSLDLSRCSGMCPAAPSWGLYQSNRIKQGRRGFSPQASKDKIEFLWFKITYLGQNMFQFYVSSTNNNLYFEYNQMRIGF